MNTKKLPEDLDEGNAPIVIHRHVHQPRPLVATRRNCSSVAGLEPRAFAKVARRMQAAGFPVTSTSDGEAVLLEDLERFLRQAGAGERDAKPDNVVEGELDLAAAAAASGMRLVAGGRR